jgi:hypothetical protein
MLMQSFATHLRFHKSKKCFTKLCAKARFNRSHTQADCKGSPLTATLGLEHPMACANAKLLDPCFKMGRVGGTTNLLTIEMRTVPARALSTHCANVQEYNRAK